MKASEMIEKLNTPQAELARLDREYRKLTQDINKTLADIMALSPMSYTISSDGQMTAVWPKEVLVAIERHKEVCQLVRAAVYGRREG